MSEDGPDWLSGSDEELLSQLAKGHTLGLANPLLRMVNTNAGKPITVAELGSVTIGGPSPHPLFSKMFTM